MNNCVVNDSLKLSFQKPPGVFYLVWFPLLALIVLGLIDAYLIPEAFALPLLLFLLLGYLAIRLPGWAVFLWGLVYAGVVFVILMLHFQEGHTERMLRPYLRTATFMSGALVAAILASYRGRLEKSYNALLGVMSSLPVAVVVSDVSGNILLMNKQAEKLLFGQVNELAGLSYFSTFTSKHEQGRAIAQYMSYFDPNNFGPFSTTLQTRGENPLSLTASISVVGSANQMYAVTIIQKAEETVTAEK